MLKDNNFQRLEKILRSRIVLVYEVSYLVKELTKDIHICLNDSSLKESI